jgi:hypothetical protein
VSHEELPHRADVAPSLHDGLAELVAPPARTSAPLLTGEDLITFAPTSNAAFAMPAPARTPSIVPLAPPATAGRRILFGTAIVAAMLVGVGGAVAVMKVGRRPAEAGTTSGTGGTASERGTPSTVLAGADSIKALRAGPDGPDESQIEWTGEGTAVTSVGPQPTTGPQNGKRELSEEERRLLERQAALEGGSGPISTKGGTGSRNGSASRGGQSLSPDQIRTAVSRNRGEIQRCYERAMRGSARMDHDLRVEVYIQVGTSGSVRTAQVRTAEVRGTELASCIEQSVRRWTFPSATGETTVVTPFVLTPRR